ncbi:FecR family protein [Stappia sp. BW2]|jgi:ferric-dicitrate binding protein FerR (iron transport regulator)|uniref:FecR family protein n=1 Tax=Stappia sp. BW2 TaxID=2592622 RepID=UPI001396BDD5|nr:FecR family protein [Stappia sp. BW2]
MSTGRLKLAITLLWMMFAASTTAMAQNVNGCERTQVQDPPRVVFQCDNGLVIEAEAASAFSIDTAAGASRPDEVDLSADAVLIEVEPGSGPFQVRTPHAIAAVRGTIYAVDVGPERTSVFVVRGHVSVSRPDGSDTVLLAAGEGADVAPGLPFAPATWSAERAAGLLSRFGQ